MTLASIRLARWEGSVAQLRTGPPAAPLSASWAQALQERAHALSWFQDALPPAPAVTEVPRPVPSSQAMGPTPASSIEGCASPGRSRARDAGASDDPGTAKTFVSRTTGARTSAAEPVPRSAGPLRSDTASQYACVLLVTPHGSECSALPAAVDDTREPSTQDRRWDLPVTARDAVRVHVEQDAESLTVWIGLDVQPPGAGVQVARATSALLRSKELAARITRVICNGTPTYASGRSALSSPATRAHYHEEQA